MTHKKIVVVHVILSLEIGGMEQVVVDLIKTIDRSRFDPVVLCVLKLGPLADELKNLGIPVILTAPMVPIWSFLYPGPLVSALRRVGAEVVHVHSGCWFKGAWGARLGGAKKVIYTLHGATYGRTFIPKLLERVAALLTNKIITVSENLAEQLLVSGHLPMDKVAVIINGIQTARFRSIPLSPQRDSVRIGVIARFEPVKDLGTLLRAMKILHDEGVRATLELIGDGSEKESLERLTVELGLGEVVRFPGFQRDTPQRLAQIDIFALSSLTEGTSISILEAMAAGKAIVATAVGGNPALVEEGVNGLLVPASDPAALAQALKRLIGDEPLRVKMGVVNKERAQSQYDVQVMTRKYEELYQPSKP